MPVLKQRAVEYNDKFNRQLTSQQSSIDENFGCKQMNYFFLETYSNTSSFNLDKPLTFM